MSENTRCIIITSYLNGKVKDLIDLEDGDFILCADGGYRVAAAENIRPSVVVGDFDSRSDFNREDVPSDIPVETWPHHKDYTDTALCLDYAMEHGYRNILIVGGFGGREDHTMANFQNLFNFAKKGAHVMMVDRQNLAFPLIEDTIYLPNRDGWYLSVFAYTEKAEGVTIKGAEYEVEDVELSSFFPLGACNWCVGNDITVSVKKGALLIIMSRDL